MPTKKVTKKKAASKKAAKKATAKKTGKPATKKAAKKAPAKATQPLVYADNSTSFWVTDGQVLNSLVALRDALEQMEKEAYQYHAHGDENDFANWVEVVLCDGDCAKALRKAKTPKSAHTVVVRHLKYYTV